MSISLNPETSVEKVVTYLELVDRVVMMTVHTNFQNRNLLLKQLKRFVSELERPPLIEADDNTKSETFTWMKALPDVYVLGISALFHHRDESGYVQ